MRDVATRKADVVAALEKQGSYFLVSADVAGRPHVIAVSAWWDTNELVITTNGASRTARNLATNPFVKLAGGDPSDAIIIDAQVIDSSAVEDSAELAGGFHDAMGWDPREMDGWMFYRLRPTRIQAFRGYDEIEGRDVMVRSRWLA
jgi:pyridoxamine 5'-phosphate oxidase-like protein